MGNKIITGILEVTGQITQNNQPIGAPIKITWSALKALKDNGELIPGNLYRIIDYTCTTVAENTSSAGHVFDIIVRADDVNRLNEEASAIQHEGDTYFANSSIEAWKIWYCFDDDRKRFSWSDEKGIIIDNELYLRNKSSDDASATYGYAWSKITGNSKVYTDTDTPTVETIAYSYKTGGVEYTISSIHESTGKGIIYRMIDNFGNDCPYDFKNMLFSRTSDQVLYTNYYTFTCFNQGTKDASKIFGCRNNVIKGTSSHPKSLPFNILYAQSTSLDCHDNIFEFGATNNTFKGPGSNNIIGRGCSNIILGSGNKNVFGPGCSNISCDRYCSNNTFLSDCYGIHLGQSCDNNFFGASCYSINFKKDDSSSLWYCHNIIVDPDCSYLEIESNESTSNSKRLKNIHIHSGVSGTYQNVKQMTLIVNLPYETDVYQNELDELIYAINNNVDNQSGGLQKIGTISLSCNTVLSLKEATVQGFTIDTSKPVIAQIAKNQTTTAIAMFAGLSDGKYYFMARSSDIATVNFDIFQ